MPGAMEEQFSFKCTTCGEIHLGLPDLAFDSPFYYHDMAAAQRSLDTELTSDTCVIAREDFFVRGCLEIPIHGRAELFGYGVWVSLSPKNFGRYQELFESRDRFDEPPYFGWLSNRLPGYPDTLGMKTNVYLRPYPLRPRIELEPTDHPLSVEQREGITIQRLQEILEANAHAA